MSWFSKIRKNDMKCPVCGNFTFNSKDYLYYICKECYWEYDPIQVDDHNYWGGANGASINEYKKVYKKLKSENPKFSCKNENDRNLMFKMTNKEILEINEEKMDLTNNIHFYKIGLLSGVFTINDFQKWLDEAFMQSDERILLDLEECNNINEIVSCINHYFHNVNYDRNPKVALKVLLRIVKHKYVWGEWNLQQILDCFDKIYIALLNDGEWWQEEPYLLMGNLSDGYGTWAYDEDIREGVRRVFEYFK